ncbi:MAG: hypothetical protein ABIG94_02310 [Pseudomonadota bacterium]
MAALVFVPVVAIVVRVLVAMHHGFMAVLMVVVGMGVSLMGMFVLMFVFAVATHLSSPPCHLIFDKF